MIKVRIGSEKDLHSFQTQEEAFNWVSDNYSSCLLSVLRYDESSLESMERWIFKNERFLKENIRE